MNAGAPDIGAAGSNNGANVDGTEGGDDANSQAMQQRKAFEMALGMIAMRIVNDAQADLDSAMDDTEEDV
ncbi:hypothetical protein AAFX91_31405 [Bradyrhizobium sp. 31Argb]|uniref:hypothetical protein n=1 Tax=Bradyrhizobium TaxID=374 RepID=UPI0004877505|nr:MULTISPECIES: hypothetical protein [Bradyrhizobium]RZN10158.1 hypothetical protein CWO90_47030 [Bradyrhizobium sp. Leo121]TAI59691.1 hypothetical protein CWO89_44885 [Bradyrhizobium sp. Leo170]